jgi:hypothetical protein
MKRCLLLALLLLMVSGCARIQSQVMPGTLITQYKTAYIEPIKEDEFNLYPVISWELADMGLKVVGIPVPENPLATDMLVKYSYVAGWDIQRYLRSFQVQFIDARNKSVVASTAYFKLGLFTSQASRLEAAFNDLRYKLNLPPTKQFD